MTFSNAVSVDESSAREVLLLRAFEAEETAAWTAADRDWASRVARASLADDAAPARFVAERARHAMQRLAPREAAVRTALAPAFALGPWTLAALLAGLLLGALVDRIGPAQHINLLAPPIWALVAWNLLVYALIGLRALLPRPANGATAAPRGLRGRLQSLWAPRAGRLAPLQRFATDWALFAAPLNQARAAWLLHLAAAALAAGLVGGLYVRGLVLDYRAGWQSTFIEAPAVHRVLQTLLAPASALTGIGVPGAAELASQRVLPGAPAQAPAAPWLHLYAATLALLVIGPRLLLALLALLKLLHRRARMALPLHEPYFQRLLRQAEGRRAAVWVLPHAAAPSAQAVLGLQSLLTAVFGDGLQLRVADPVPYGDEDQPARCTPPAGCSWVLVLFDLGSTPEAEVQGRLLDTLARAAPGLPLRVVVDETAFVQRFGADARRREERRAAWQRFVQARGLPLLVADLLAPDAQAVDAVREALGA